MVLKFFLKLFFVVGIAYIFISYGTDKLLQTFTGLTYLSGDTIDNDVVSLKTGITVFEYDDHILVKQASGYIRFMALFQFIDDRLFSGLLQEFLPSFLGMDITSEVSTFDVIKLFLVVSAIPVLVGIIFIIVLKKVGKKLLYGGSWFFVGAFLSLLVLFFTVYQPIVDNIANVRMLLTYNSDASEATMEILQSAVDKKVKEEGQANTILSHFFSDKEKQSEIHIYLGDQLKVIHNSPAHALPPNLTNIIQSERYQNADGNEKKKLNDEQIKHNANELRKLIFWVYST